LIARRAQIGSVIRGRLSEGAMTSTMKRHGRTQPSSLM